MEQLIIIFSLFKLLLFLTFFVTKVFNPKKVLTVFCMKVMEYVEELFFA